MKINLRFNGLLDSLKKEKKKKLNASLFQIQIINVLHSNILQAGIRPLLQRTCLSGVSSIFSTL